MDSILKRTANKAVTVTIEGEDYVLKLPPHEVRNEIMGMAATFAREPDAPEPTAEEGFEMFTAVCDVCAKACTATVVDSDMDSDDWNRLATLVFSPDPDSEYPEGLDDLFIQALTLCGLKDMQETVTGFKEGVQKRLQQKKDGDDGDGVQNHVGEVDAGLGK